MSVDKIQKSRVDRFVDFSMKHLEATIAKVVGVVALLIVFGVIGAIGFGIYKAVTHGVSWREIVFYVPYLAVPCILPVIGLWFLFLYGKKMLTAKPIEAPTNSLEEL